MATPPDFTAGQVLTAAQMSKIGLWLISAASFTTLTEVPLTSQFTDDYDRYLLMVTVTTTSATSADLYLRLRSGSTNAAGTDYYGIAAGISPSGTANNILGNGVTYYPICGLYTGLRETARIEINSPKSAVRTNFSHQSYGFTSGGGNVSYQGGCQHALATAYDGCALLPSTGNMTGYYKLYGYRN